MELDRLTDWLLCLRTPSVQAYAVRHDDGVSLIDTTTAGNADAILAALERALGEPPRLRDIVLTHGHADHTGSAAALVEKTGGRVLGPALEVDVIEGRREHADPQLLDWERPIFEQVTPQVPAAPPVTVDVRLEPGERLPWGREAYVVAAPGHTPGQLVVWFPQDRVLVAADAMASHDGAPMPGVFNIEPAQAAETYAALAALDPDIACFGHGAPLIGAAGERLRRAQHRLCAPAPSSPLGSDHWPQRNQNARRTHRPRLPASVDACAAGAGVTASGPVTAPMRPRRDEGTESAMHPPHIELARSLNDDRHRRAEHRP